MSKSVSSLSRMLSARDAAMLLLGAFIQAAGVSNIHAFSGVTEGGVLGMTLDGMLPAEKESAPESAPASESGSASAASAAD